MSEAAQIDIFGNEESPFASAKERYGLWPVTVWDVDVRDPYTRKLRDAIGDAGQNREGSFTKDTDDKSTYRGKLSASIFSPAVASWALNLYAPADGGTVVDPFAGGGTRAIIAASLGHHYVGTELREDEAADVTGRATALGFADRVRIVHGDARSIDQHVRDADVLLTCPPYWNMERYEGGPADLSQAATYDEFLEGIRDVAKAALFTLKPGAAAVWVVGLHRTSDGTLLPLNHDIARVHRDVGWVFREEIVLRRIGDGSMTRIGQFEKGRGHLVRQHEYALVFRKPA